MPISTTHRAEEASRTSGWALTSLSLAVLLASLGTSGANVALPTLGQAFGAGMGAVQWVVLAYLVAMTALLVAAGRLGDLIGRRRLFVAGLLLSGAASASCAVAPSLAVLIGARAVQGAGAAVLMSMAFALAGEGVSEQRRGAVMGLLAAMSSLGTTLGPAAGGLFLAGPGWRALVLLPLPLAAAAGLSGWRHLPKPTINPGLRGAAMDWLGVVLLATSLGAYAIALTPEQGSEARDGITIGLLVAAVALILFVVRQARTASPLLALDLFRNPALDTGLAANALVSTVMMATLVTGPFYLSRALGLSAGQVGLVLAAGPCVAVLGGVPAGRLADRFGAQATASAGLILLTAGAGWLSLASLAHGTLGYVLPVVLLSAGYAAFQAPNTTAVMARAEADRRGAISGLLNLARNLGLLTGASLMGTVFAAGVRAASGAAPSSPDTVAAGMRACFRLATVLGGSAVLLSLFPFAMSSYLNRRPVTSLSNANSKKEDGG